MEIQSAERKEGTLEKTHSTISLTEQLSDLELSEKLKTVRSREPANAPNVHLEPVGGDMRKTQRSIAHPSGAALYVGNLSSRAVESEIRGLFEEVGEILSVRICKDALTGKSLGYAYVNLASVSAAEKAIEFLNHYPLHGQQIRVMWSQRNPSVRRSGEGNILVKNLDKTIDNKTLHDTFETFGRITSCQIACNEEGESKGYGFIHFEEKKAAEDAINLVNGKVLRGAQLIVCKHIPAPLRPNATEKRKKTFTNLYVKGFGPSIGNAELSEMFKPFGEIQHCEVQFYADGAPAGFGFVNYTTHKEAVCAITAMHEKNVQGATLYVARALSKAERKEELQQKFAETKAKLRENQKDNNLYIRNLDPKRTDIDLREMFCDFGEITSCQVMKANNGVSRGFGFVCYTTAESAKKAISEYNGKIVDKKPLYVGFALSKEERMEILAEQYQRCYQEKMRELLPSKYTQSEPPRKASNTQQREGSKYWKNEGTRYSKTSESRKELQTSEKDKKINYKGLAKLSIEERKKALEEELITRISSHFPKKEQCAEVVKFILKLGDVAVIDALDSKEVLLGRISEAIKKSEETLKGSQ